MVRSVPQVLLDELCVLGAAGAPLLVEAFAAGGDPARLAYAAWMDPSCPGDSTGQAVLDAFDVMWETTEFSDPATAWR